MIKISGVRSLKHIPPPFLELDFLFIASHDNLNRVKKEDLIGRWEISREVHTLDGAFKSKMWGEGIFTLFEEGHLLYREKLFHEMKDGELLTAKKSYRYSFEEGQILIYFHEEESNRQFLKLIPSEGNLKGEASCKADRYALEWKWLSPDAFMTTYEIQGPKKAMKIKSKYDLCE